LVRHQDLQPEISAAVFAAHSPQMLKPIITSSGIHLILVEEIILPELNEKLRWQIISHLFSEWLKQQIEQVEIFVAG
jgi:parvulin-like peptidyl-prolyl isomerase